MATILGDDNDNVLIGSGDDDVIFGFAGNDRLKGGPGNDQLNGGAGTDTAEFEGIGGVTADLSAGTAFSADGGIDALASIENLIGTNSDDSLAGDGKNNVLSGRGGNDVLNGLNGDDVLDGGDGNDTLNSGNGNDTISGGAGNDSLDGEDADDTISGGAGNDSLDGGNGDDALDGGDGDDNLYGRQRNDILYGRDGVDHLHGGAGNDLLDGGAGNDELEGEQGDDTLLGGTGSDSLTGGPGDDFIDGGVGGVDNVFYLDARSGVTVNLSIVGPQDIGGGHGFDTLINIERVFGSAFDDVLIGDDNSNVFFGGGRNDVLDGRLGADNANYSRAQSSVTVNLSISGPQFVSVSEGFDTLINIEGLVGSAFADTLTGDDNNNFLAGRNGDDILNGGGGNDVVAYAGDTISGVTVELGISGPQNVGGGAGMDTFISIEGLTGSQFNDTLKGDDNDNTLAGNQGDDFLDGRGGNDTADYAGGGTLQVPTGGVTVNLSISGPQNIGGGQGLDTLISIENIFGSSFGDTLTGDAGANVLTGNGGGDTLAGGAGADRYVYSSESQSTVSLSGRDVITDFKQGGDADIIDLAGIYSGVLSFDGNPTPAIDPGVTAHHVTWYESGGNTIVQADVSGDTVADFAITLTGVGLGLTSADFVL